jgi:predicted metalloprotease
MRWTPKGRSKDIEDRRGQAPRMGRGVSMGLGGLLLLGLLSLLTGQDFMSMIPASDSGGGTPFGAGPTGGSPIPSSPEDTRLEDFVSFVLDDNQDVWERVLGGRYQRSTLVLFTDAVDSSCGFAESATGPFYCPADQKVYIDLGFYRELHERFGAPGEFAQAYVLAHEIGHHVQHLLGTDAQVRQAQQRNPAGANQLSVALELQADCYAGIWGNSTAQRQLLVQGDLEDGLNAAAAIGDDRMQRMAGARVSPERFTHGSSAQRVEWFRRGLQSGKPESCNTFDR